MMVYVPDGMGSPQGFNNTDPMLSLAKEIVKRDKIERKKKQKDDEKKEAKNKPKLFTLLETTGILMLSSIPVTLAQLWLLNYTQQVLSATFNVPH